MKTEIHLIRHYELVSESHPLWNNSFVLMNILQYVKKEYGYRLFLDNLAVMAKVPLSIPFRTRQRNPSAPMVLGLKARESRSLPDFSRTIRYKKHIYAVNFSHPFLKRDFFIAIK